MLSPDSRGRRDRRAAIRTRDLRHGSSPTGQSTCSEAPCPPRQPDEPTRRMPSTARLRAVRNDGLRLDAGSMEDRLSGPGLSREAQVQNIYLFSYLPARHDRLTSLEPLLTGPELKRDGLLSPSRQRRALSDLGDEAFRDTCDGARSPGELDVRVRTQPVQRLRRTRRLSDVNRSGSSRQRAK